MEEHYALVGTDLSNYPDDHKEAIQKAFNETDGHYWIPDSFQAAQIIQQLLPIMNPGGSIVTSQLTTNHDRLSNADDGFRIMGTTSGASVSEDIFKHLENDTSNLKIERGDGDTLSESCAIFIFTKK